MREPNALISHRRTGARPERGRFAGLCKGRLPVPGRAPQDNHRPTVLRDLLIRSYKIWLLNRYKIYLEY